MSPPDATNDRVTLSDLMVVAQTQSLRDQMASQTAPWPRWMTFEVASRYCSLSIKTLRRAVASGKVSGHRLAAGRILIDKRQLDSAISAARDQ